MIAAAQETSGFAASLAAQVQSRSTPWEVSIPEVPLHLPYSGMVIESITPKPHWAIVHRNIRGLHGCLTVLSGDGHQPRWPTLILRPWACESGWGVLFHREATARRLAGREWPVRLWEQLVTLRCGPLLRPKAPVRRVAGRYRLVVHAQTPVVIRSHAATERRVRTEPTAEAIASAVGNEFGMRCGAGWVLPQAIPIEIVRDSTRPETVPVGGKWGRVTGWVGPVILETNALGRWLLECSAIVGLGGRTALGFGSVAVRDA